MSSTAEQNILHTSPGPRDLKETAGRNSDSGFSPKENEKGKPPQPDDAETRENRNIGEAQEVMSEDADESAYNDEITENKP